MFSAGKDVFGRDAESAPDLVNVAPRQLCAGLREPVADAHRLPHAVGVQVRRGHDDLVAARVIDAVAVPEEVTLDLLPLGPGLAHASKGSLRVVLKVCLGGAATRNSRGQCP